MINIKTPRTQLTLLDSEHAGLLLEYRLTNRDHLTPWEPVRSRGFYTLEQCEHQLTEQYKSFEEGSGFQLTAMTPDRKEIIGLCNFNNVVHGAFQACHLGYSISKKYQGQGLMFEIVSAGMDYIFQEAKLHRIMANYIPDNHRSAALLEKLGFEVEGRARSYLKIAGKWQDHILTSRINPADH
ncbi:GNAT family N-acetyltransferase [Endozoicomonas sp. 8E]|uniref:GNAT family N-acetyltransferase n=1 Tax=Endozoicomonas sp. 8E TaxID=3035692 RepID=UPI002938E219|nr:GNAT family N-acetyltransferase [Endozoicomonas sp. 8E]WOG25946.1 GNAT family N-acetyltransferase [Endozoicomonas sp. 8E]